MAEANVTTGEQTFVPYSVTFDLGPRPSNATGRYFNIGTGETVWQDTGTAQTDTIDLGYIATGATYDAFCGWILSGPDERTVVTCQFSA